MCTSPLFISKLVKTLTDKSLFVCVCAHNQYSFIKLQIGVKTNCVENKLNHCEIGQN